LDPWFHKPKGAIKENIHDWNMDQLLFTSLIAVAVKYLHVCLIIKWLRLLPLEGEGGGESQ